MPLAPVAAPGFTRESREDHGPDDQGDPGLSGRLRGNQHGYRCTTKGDAVHSWTEGPFTNEAKARESLQWQFAVPVIEKL